MQNAHMPLVSIGVPVYNGGKTLSDALHSLLAQDYKNLEIIISDNGSTDDTPKICKDFANKDVRVRYYRSDENLGSCWNFNRVFDLSHGKYFMWAAHDDLRKTSFVKSCVQKLEQSPESVLCQTKTSVFIEHQLNSVYTASLDSFAGLNDPIQRYKETLKNFPATAIYGMYRSSVISKTRLFEKVIATDLAFIQELSIHGSFVQVDDILFHYVGRKKWNTVDQDYKVFFGVSKKPWWYIPFVALFCNHFSRVSTMPLPFDIKCRCWWILIQNELSQILLKIIMRICGKFCPSSFKEKLGSFIYWRWVHNHNLEIRDPELFFNRIIKPKLGWWT